MKPAFADIAKKAHVDLIVADLPYADSSIETVDVTGFALDWLQANEATRKIVADVGRASAPDSK